MASVFPIGTIVYLKSGSPPLTVTAFGGPPGTVQVEWFVGGELKRDALLPESVTTAPPKPPPPRNIFGLCRNLFNNG